MICVAMVTTHGAVDCDYLSLHIPLLVVMVTTHAIVDLQAGLVDSG